MSFIVGDKHGFVCVNVQEFALQGKKRHLIEGNIETWNQSYMRRSLSDHHLAAKEQVDLEMTMYECCGDSWKAMCLCLFDLSDLVLSSKIHLYQPNDRIAVYFIQRTSHSEIRRPGTQKTKRRNVVVPSVWSPQRGHNKLFWMRRDAYLIRNIWQITNTCLSFKTHFIPRLAWQLMRSLICVLMFFTTRSAISQLLSWRPVYTQSAIWARHTGVWQHERR